MTFSEFSVPSAIELLLLSAALFFIWPRSGFAKYPTSDGAGGAMARWLLPAVVIGPFLLAQIRIKGQLAGLHGAELGVTLYATFTAVIFAGLVWFNARQMNKEYEKRSRAEGAILELNRNLEGRIIEGTKALEQQTHLLTGQTSVLSEQEALLDLAHDSIFVRDINDRITFWNKGATQNYGWTKEQALGQVTHELLKTAFPDSLEQIEAELLAHGSWEGELSHVRADGSRIIVASRWAVQRDADGNPRAVLEINNDITERKRAQAALRLSEERLNLLTQGVKDHAIFMLDTEGRVATWNKGAELLKGYAAEEIIGQHFANFYTPGAIADGTPAQELRIAVEQGYCENEGWRLRKNGSRFWASVMITPLRDKTGHLLGFGKVTRDITVRKEAESKILSLAERLALATTIARVGVWEWDLSQNTVAWDATMFEIYGFRPEDKWSVPMPYEKWATTVHPDDLRAAEVMLERAIKGRNPESAEFRITRPDGSVRDILAIEKAVLDVHGEVVRMVGVNTDITEQKEAAKILAQSGIDQLRFKDEFLSHVSHEIRAPLSAIMQFTGIILDGLAGEITPEQRQFEQIVLQNARQLQSMIVDLLEVTRMENGKLSVEPEVLSVNGTIADVLNTMRGNAVTKGIDLSSELPDGLQATYADPTRLRQILIILIDNAIKFTPRGGRVKIQVQPWKEDPQFLCIGVSDTGSGIEPEKVERIFERLYQASHDHRAMKEGLGIGLYICKDLVSQQGGQIWVESKLHKGSSFSFTLPIFSLKRFIVPMLKNDKWPNESAALVTVEMRLPEPWPSKDSQGEWSEEVHSILQSCTLPNLDVLLPKISSRAEGERFFVLAFADEKGATVLANRIREQFERLPRLNEAGLTLTVSHSMLNSFTRDDSTSVSDIVATLAANLEEKIGPQNMGMSHHA